MIAASASRASHLDANGSWLVELEGEHDIATIPLLQQQTRDVWPRCTLAVIDLSAATFIDCSVVAWLLRSRDALDDNTSVVRRLRVAEGRSAPAVQRVFDVLRLREEFDCYATRAGALDDRPSGSSEALLGSIDRPFLGYLPEAGRNKVSGWTSTGERHQR